MLGQGFLYSELGMCHYQPTGKSLPADLMTATLFFLIYPNNTAAHEYPHHPLGLSTLTAAT